MECVAARFFSARRLIRQRLIPRSQWFIFAAAFMISACTTGMMSAM